MKLAQAARFFDRAKVNDSATGLLLCKGQLDLFDESRRDGVGVDRRILATAPDALTLPTNRTVELEGTHYIVGDVKSDTFNGKKIRDKYILHQAGEVVKYARINDFLTLDNATLPVGRAGVTWVKDLKLETWSSDPRDMFAFYVGTQSPMDVDYLLHVGDHYYRVRAAFLTAGGFKLLEANRLQQGALGTATYYASAGAFNPVQGKLTPVAGVNIPALLMHFHDDYEYLNPAVEKYEAGDTTLRVSQATAAKVGDHYEHSGKKYRVVTAYKLPDGSWSLHGKAVNK